MTRSYSPSPRPTFPGPALISIDNAVRHIWGDETSGEVADWIYVSSDLVHCLVFGLAIGRAFRHSPEFRTVFGADELLHVLSGTMVLANPETGEVHRIEEGGSAIFGPDTWHHAFAHGPKPLRVLEFFAPPPSAGTSGTYARTRPYLELSESRYGLDEMLEGWPRATDPGATRATIRTVTEQGITWRRDLEVLQGIMLSTPNLTAGRLELNSGESSIRHRHQGDEVLYVVEGVLHVRAETPDGAVRVFEAGEGDAVYLPAGTDHEYSTYQGGAVAMFAVAPKLTP